MHCNFKLGSARPRLRARRGRAGAHGLSLVELLVAMALGLVLVVGVATVYLFTKTAFNRQAQLSSLQQNVRTAFEFLGNDVRMVGHLGCFTGSSTGWSADLSVANVKTNYVVGIEGFDYDDAGTGAYALTSDNPANVTDVSKWKTNAQGTAPKTVPLAALGGGLTPGSDVLVVRTTVGQPIRLRSDTGAAGDALEIETTAGGTCSDGAAKVSGFCVGSHGLLANCTAARIFSVGAIAGSTITPASVVGAPYVAFPAATSEVFPLQTVVYYVKRSLNHPGTTSLYRTIFNGDPAGGAGVEQELIEDVESLQVQYGEDTTLPDPDGAVDRYIRADQVTSTNWSNIDTVRMSLLLRSATPLPADVAVAASAAVNGLSISYPSGSRYDRRVFTTTVAIRNRIAYF